MFVEDGKFLTIVSLSVADSLVMALSVSSGSGSPGTGGVPVVGGAFNYVVNPGEGSLVELL